MLSFGIHIGGRMGDVIDLAIFKKSRDIQQSILHTPAGDKPPRARLLTLRLNLLALKATRIFYYTSPNGTWKTTSARNFCIVLQDFLYKLTQPSPYLIRLIVYDSSNTHIDLYFPRKFYTSPEAITMLTALVDEAMDRGCYVDTHLLLKINYIKKVQNTPLKYHIDWESLHHNPFGDNPSPSKP
jgi:hypothetical protein